MTALTPEMRDEIVKIVTEALKPLKVELSRLKSEVSTIAEFDETMIRPLFDNHEPTAKKFDKVAQNQLLVDTRLEALEQFMADIVPERHRLKFQRRIDRLEELNPAARNLSDAALLAQNSVETEPQRIVRSEREKLLARQDGDVGVDLKPHESDFRDRKKLPSRKK